MKLVDYPSSDDDDEQRDEEQPPTSTTRPSLPQLPPHFHDLYSGLDLLYLISFLVKPRIGDDPFLHEGRIRGQPHVAGQWPTHAYIECKPVPAAPVDD